MGLVEVVQVPAALHPLPPDLADSAALPLPPAQAQLPEGAVVGVAEDVQAVAEVATTAEVVTMGVATTEEAGVETSVEAGHKVPVKVTPTAQALVEVVDSEVGTTPI